MSFAANNDASFCEEFFTIALAQVAAKVQPDCVGNHVGWESMAFVLYLFIRRFYQL
jgi:hypothetical protein